MTVRKAPCKFFTGIILTAFVALRVGAATITWTNTAGGNWNTPANWAPNQVPGSSDTALITTAGTYAVTLNVSATVTALTIGGASGTQSLQSSSFNLTATNATVASGGALGLTNLTMTGALTLESGGTLTTGGATLNSQVTVQSGGLFFLTGTTYIGQGGQNANSNYWLSVENGGMLTADSSAPLYPYCPMTNAGNINVTNEGIFPANNGGPGYYGGVVNQSSGTITLWGTAYFNGQYGSEYLINEGTISLGNDSSQILFNYLTNNGTISALPGSSTLVVGTFNSLGALTGNYNAAAGTIIQFHAGNSPGTSPGADLVLGGSGQYQFTQGLLNLPDNVIPGVAMTAGTVALGPDFQGGAITNLTLNGATLTNTLPLTGPLLMTNGTLLTVPLALTSGTNLILSGVTETGNITVENGATLLSSGTTFNSQMTVESGGLFLLTGSTYMGQGGQNGNSNDWLWVQTGGSLIGEFPAPLYLYCPMTNAGSINVTNEGIFPANNGGPGYYGGVVNQSSGTITLWGTAYFDGQYGDEYLINQGTISLGSASSQVLFNFITNNGIMSTQPGSGTLKIGTFSGTGALTGNYFAAANTIIQFVASANPGTSPGAGLVLGGTGQYQFVQGLLTLPNSGIPGLTITGGSLSLGPDFEGGTITNLAVDGISLSNTLPVTGTLAITNGTLLTIPLTLPSGATLILNGVTETGAITVESGATLISSGTTFESQVTVESGGTFLLTGNTYMGQPGQSGNSNDWLWVQNGGSLIGESTAPLYLLCPMTNAGSINMTNYGIFPENTGAPGYDGGVVNQSSGTITLWSTANFNGQYGGEYLINQGTVSLGSSSGQMLINYLTNNGTISALPGSSTFTVGTFNSLGGLTGYFNAAAGTTIQFHAGNNPGTSAGAGLVLGGSGQYQFTQGLLTLPDDVIPGVTMTGGSVALGPDFQGGAITNLVLNGASLSNSLPISGALGSTNSTFTGVYNISHGGILTANGATFNAQVTVQSNGLFLVTGNTYIGQAGQASDATNWLWVQNGGTLNADSSAPLYLYCPMTNAGVVNMTNYGLYINNNNSSGYEGWLINQSSGIFTLWNTAYIQGSYGHEYVVNQGTLANNSFNNTGEITVNDFTNMGVLQAQRGILLLECPNTVLNPAGSLGIQVNSATDAGGISYNSSTALNLSQIGTLSITLSNGYIPAVGSSYKVLNASGSGTFSSAFANFASPDGAIWQLAYAPASLTITNEGQLAWAAPAAITYGAALGSEQLDATVTPTMAGNFLYNPASGTVLNSGNGQALLTTFTPGNVNYMPASLQTSVNVLKASLGITASNQTKTYGQTFSFAGNEFAPAGLTNGDTTTTATISSLGQPPTASVTNSPYTITIANVNGDAGLTNYIITYVPGQLTVQPAPLSITASNAAKTYGQTVTFVGDEFSSIGLQNSETIGSVTLASDGAPATASVSGSPYLIVPSAPIGGTFNTNDYAIIYNDGSLTVNRAGLTVTANNTSRAYGAANPTFSAAISGFVNNEGTSVIGGIPAFSVLAGAASPVGPYAITPSLGSLTAANYTFVSFVPGTLLVMPASLTITASNQSKTYGQTLTFVGNEFSSVGLQNSETIGSVTLTSSGALATAGVGGSPYLIVPTNAIAGTFSPTNYSIVYDDGTLTINRASLAVSANNASRAYGAANPTFADTITGFVNGEGLSAISGTASLTTTAIATTPVGMYPITAALGSLTATNYSFASFSNGALTISQAPLTITASNQSKTYGQTLTFVGNEFFSAGLQNSETIGSVTLTSSGAPATAAVNGSPYLIVPTNATAGTFSPTNYSIAYNAGSLTVNRAGLAVTASNASRAYGAANPVFGASYSGFVNGDGASAITGTPSLTTTATATTTVGAYPITAALGSLTAANYSFTTFSNGTLTINKAPLTITAANTNKIFGQTVTFAGSEFSSAGLQNSETVGSVSLGSAGAPASAAVGSYPITPGSATGGTFTPGNYTITYTNGSLAVSAQPSLTITLSGGDYLLGAPTVTNEFYQFQGATNIVGAWSGLGSARAGTGGAITYSNSAPNAPTYFRLLIHF